LIKGKETETKEIIKNPGGEFIAGKTE